MLCTDLGFENETNLVVVVAPNFQMIGVHGLVAEFEEFGPQLDARRICQVVDLFTVRPLMTKIFCLEISGGAGDTKSF